MSLRYTMSIEVKDDCSSGNATEALLNRLIILKPSNQRGRYITLDDWISIPLAKTGHIGIH